MIKTVRAPLGAQDIIRFRLWPCIFCGGATRFFNQKAMEFVCDKCSKEKSMEELATIATEAKTT